MNRVLIPAAILLLLSYTWCNSTVIYASFNKTAIEYSKPTVANSSVIWVPSDNYPTIQGAINNAKEGDTVFVRNGTYFERVVIDKSLSLVGENKYETILDGGRTETIVIVTANNVVISNITVQNGEFGVWLRGSRNNILADNVFTNNSEGIHLWGSSSNVLTGNVASNNWAGIHLLGSSSNVLTGNVASNNWYGTYLDDSSLNTLVDNVVFSNNDGVRLYHSDNNFLSGNTALNNSCGFYVGDSDDNALSGNNALHNQRGFLFYHSRNNLLRGNIMANNSQYGVFLESSSTNKILQNNFVDNIASQCRSIDSANSWDNGVEGNYWSDYDGTDTNRDGIGDAPYLVEKNCQDNCPLMAMFLQFRILVENQSHMIDAVSNSTISDFHFHSDSYNTTNAVSLKADGAGFCRISIPNALIEPPFEVRLNDSQPLYFHKVYTNGTHTWLYFAYNHSEHEITITHTFSLEQLVSYQWTIFGLVIIIVILLSISVNYYRLFNKERRVIEAYEREVGGFPISHEERARMRFIKDVITREEKIEKFGRKYGIKIQPASSLEDIMEKLNVQKEVKH